MAKIEIRREAAVGNYRNSGELPGLETLLCCFQWDIRTDREVGDCVKTVTVGFHGARSLRFHVGDLEDGAPGTAAPVGSVMQPKMRPKLV